MGAVGLGWGMDGIKKNMGKRAEGREFNKLRVSVLEDESLC